MLMQNKAAQQHCTISDIYIAIDKTHRIICNYNAYNYRHCPISAKYKNTYTHSIGHEVPSKTKYLQLSSVPYKAKKNANLSMLIEPSVMFSVMMFMIVMKHKYMERQR